MSSLGLLKIILMFFSVSSVLSDVSSIDRLFFTHVSPEGGYVYPAPSFPPVQLDEPSPLPPIYLPPIDEIPLQPPPASYLPPNRPPPVFIDDTVVIPAQPPPQMSYLPPANPVRIENMSCIHGIHFRATFTMNNQFSSPVVDESAEKCIYDLNKNAFKIELEDHNHMIRCGVRSCRPSGENSTARTDNMCLMIRIPTVKGVRLPEDKMVTLMCIPQEKVVRETKHVKLGTRKIQQISKARSNDGIVATGGTQKNLKTQIGIFRKRPGSRVFDENIQTDSIIELGEELLLRAIISETDGWKNSQIGPVLITGLNSKKSALLVTQHGCVNPIMRSICPKQPVKVNPLVTELYFRAFLFQESPQGDEMVLSVRTQGCLHAHDCLTVQSCEEVHSRSKRGFQPKKAENSSLTHPNIEGWELQLSFKVEPHTTQLNDLARTKYSVKDTFVLISVFLVGLALILVVLLWLVGRSYCLTRDKNVI